MRCRLHLKCDGTHTETRFCLSAKWPSPFKSVVASVQSTTGSRGVRISGNNSGYTMFRSIVKGTGYPLHLPISPSLSLLCVTVCHHVSTGLSPLNLLPSFVEKKDVPFLPRIELRFVPYIHLRHRWRCQTLLYLLTKFYYCFAQFVNNYVFETWRS
jgi:hypothetical protein